MNNTIEENTVRKYILKKYFSKYIDDTDTRNYVLNIVKLMLRGSDKDSIIKVIKNYKTYGDLSEKLELHKRCYIYYKIFFIKQSLLLLKEKEKQKKKVEEAEVEKEVEKKTEKKKTVSVSKEEEKPKNITLELFDWGWSIETMKQWDIYHRNDEHPLYKRFIESIASSD